MRFDATKLAELVDEESRLRAQQREISTKLNEMQESDTPWDDPRTAEYHRLTADHGRIALDLQAVSSARRDYELREPRSARKAQAGPLARFLRRGRNGLEADEIKLHCEVSDDAAAAAQMGMGGPVEGFSLKMTPLHASRAPGALRPQAQTRSDNTTGQELVQEVVPPRVIDRLAYYGGIGRMAQQFMTATGGEYRMPTEDNASQSGEILGSQDTAVSALDMSNFAAAVFGSKTASSRPISITREMVQDAVFDIQMYAERTAVRRLGRAWDTAMTTNAVGGEPQGVRNCMIVGTGAGNTEQVTATADTTVWGRSREPHLQDRPRVSRGWRDG